MHSMGRLLVSYLSLVTFFVANLPPCSAVTTLVVRDSSEQQEPMCEGAACPHCVDAKHCKSACTKHQEFCATCSKCRQGSARDIGNAQENAGSERPSPCPRCPCPGGCAF